MVGDEPGGVVVYVGDAFPTVGEMDLESLQARIDRLPHAVRTYGVALGEESNLALLEGLSRRGGFASRVSDRTEAAEMAYRILADASIPVFEGVTYTIDGGVERLYPRGVQTIRVNEPIRILGRLTGEKDPELITVQGYFGGKPFTFELDPVIEEIDDHGDLRLRWATRRLEGLMVEGAGREAIVELGNRFSMVTPFNSILVPSGSPDNANYDIRSRGAGSTSVTSAPMPAVVDIDGEMAEPEMAYEVAMPAAKAKGDDEPTTGTAKLVVGNPTVKGDLDKAMVRNVVRKHLGELRYCHEQYADYPGQSGNVEVKFVISTSGAVQMASVASSTLSNSSVESCVTQAFKKWSFPAPGNGGIVIVTIPIAFKGSSGGALGGGIFAAMPAPGSTTTTSTSLTLTHSTTTTVDPSGPGGISANQKACLLASLTPIEDKITLWQERLGDSASASHAMEVWREATSRCELRTMKDRRALARVILSAVRGIPGRCSLVNSLSHQPAVAAYIRSKILASVTSPAQIDAVMTYCDGALTIGPDDLEKVLEKAKSSDARFKAVKELMALYPMDMDLELTLLSMLEDDGSEQRLAEAMRLAEELRHAPYATAMMRTRVGEFYMRNGLDDEARRTFSEIVEFSPFTPSARRLLGDLYRNYGWAEDAYRQYETLQAMVPEDESVLILMAEAAADAGRTDEALRLAERVSQSSSGSASTAEIARLFNAIRLALLRVEARSEGDEAKLKELMKRSRRAGVLRDTADLRVVLVWDHPDVKLKLFAQFEGSEIERASLVAPHFGCESLHEKEGSGEHIVQVVRDPTSIAKETKAKLYVLWHEGTENETLEVIDVQLTDEPKNKDEKVQKAWILKAPPGGAQETKPIKIELGSIKGLVK
jgi:TonB family protein